MSLPELVGHGPVVERLRSAFEGNRLAHALLFAGPEGIGKSLAARTLAGRLLCADRTRPGCGECEGCRQVAAGSHADFSLLALAEGKKEIGVDAVRQLKRSLGIKSTSGRGRIAIVDDADRLSIAAQNALLKTLEEPPSRVLILLVTASPGALASTVRSRCQRVLFRPLDAAQVAAILEERHGLPRDQAGELAADADGSPGKALRLREMRQSDEHQLLLTLLADLDPSRYVSVLRMSKALGRTEQGTAARLELLLSWYRDAAVGSVRPGDGSVPPRPGDPDRAVRAGAFVAEAMSALRRRNPNRPLLLEALCLRLASL